MDFISQRPWFITGAGGTVGRALVAEARSRNIPVEPWQRSGSRWATALAVQEQLEVIRPAAVIHLAIAGEGASPEEARWVNEELPGFLAGWCAVSGVPLVHTSSVMVFEESGSGPFWPGSEPRAQSGYGASKRRAEEAVLRASKTALVARLGWQIDEHPQGNTMTRHLEDLMHRDGLIRASALWIPACSFVSDTAAWIAQRILGGSDDKGQIFHVDGNEGWSFYQIVSELRNRWFGHWQIEPDNSFVFDQRLQGPGREGLGLRRHLGGLPSVK